MIGARRANVGAALRRSVERVAVSSSTCGRAVARSTRARGLHTSSAALGTRWQSYDADINPPPSYTPRQAPKEAAEGEQEEDLSGEHEEAEFDQEAFDAGEYQLYPEALVTEWTKDRPDPATLASKGEWTPESRRTGVLGRKMGMVSFWDHWGKQYHCTVVHIDNCQVTAINSTANRFDQIQLQLGIGDAKPKNVNKQQLVHFKKAGVAPKKKLASFPVSRDALLPVGYTMDARHFIPGQYVDVRGTTIGKGFQGVMKRFGFGGQPASHGASLSHRSGGSIGNATSPGKVWKNKKMPGKMGNKRRTVQNVKVIKIDTTRNLVFLRGQIPGYQGNWVTLSDAIKKEFTKEVHPPFPTYIPTEGEESPQYLTIPPVDEDPYIF